MTVKIDGNKIKQITKTKDAYIVWLNNGQSIRLDANGKLKYAFQCGAWNVFEEAIKKHK